MQQYGFNFLLFILIPSVWDFEQSFGTYAPLGIISGFSFQQSLVGSENPDALVLSQHLYQQSPSHCILRCLWKHPHTPSLFTSNLPTPERESDPYDCALFCHLQA